VECCGPLPWNRGDEMPCPRLRETLVLPFRCIRRGLSRRKESHWWSQSPHKTGVVIPRVAKNHRRNTRPTRNDGFTIVLQSRGQSFQNNLGENPVPLADNVGGSGRKCRGHLFVWVGAFDEDRKNGKGKRRPGTRMWRRRRADGWRRGAAPSHGRSRRQGLA